MDEVLLVADLVEAETARERLTRISAKPSASIT
jgi:hypothetical protein